MTLIVIVAAAAVWWAARRGLPGSGAGRSAAAHARQLRTPLVRLAELAGVRTADGDRARRFDQGAEGERRTAVRMWPLRLTGWKVLHDRGLSGSRANVDHLAVSPRGNAFVVDTKAWNPGKRARAINGRFFHGTSDVTDRLLGVRYETRTVAHALDVPVTAVVAMDGPPVEGGELLLDGIRIVPADRLTATLRHLDRQTPGHGPALRRRAADQFPPYGRPPR